MNIKIENKIIVFTLKKIYKNNAWYQGVLDANSESHNMLEDLDNGFISKKALELIVKEIFKEQGNGGFRKSLDCFGSRKSTKRFIKSELEELLK